MSQDRHMRRTYT